jgi:hypothetical protein
LALLTNLTSRELALPAVDHDRLVDIPLLIPSSGVITDFLARWYGPDYRDLLHVVAVVDDVYYGLALLRSGLTRGCMIASRTIAESAMDGRLPGRSDFRVIEFGDGFVPHLELVSGVFGRAGDRKNYKSDHPINLLWQAFAREAAAATHPTGGPEHAGGLTEPEQTLR